jgi:hypothetical protein
LEEVSLLVDTENFVDETDIHYVFDESPKNKVFELGIEKNSFVDFLGIGKGLRLGNIFIKSMD